MRQLNYGGRFHPDYGADDLHGCLTQIWPFNQAIFVAEGLPLATINRTIPILQDLRKVLNHEPITRS